MKLLKSKLKSPKVWMGIISASVLLVTSIGEIFGFSIDVPAVNEAVSVICTVLVILGVLSNPDSAAETVSSGIEEREKADNALLTEDNLSVSGNGEKSDDNDSISD